ncbi:MAG: glycosyltransferase family 39 protein [Candidatus Doudnabacteria bacterium]|nr:glycosyltransferase family 39 protein [Candidatus Doudnabacteria bacterium]
MNKISPFPRKRESKNKVPDQVRDGNSTLWLVPILVVATLLRFYNNTAVALWHDEAFSALYIRYSWGEMMYRIGLDVHPPLYYWILRLWSYIFGSGLLSLRGLSILFGVLTVYAGYLFARKAFNNEKLAMVTAFLLAINPFQIQYSLEARMYTLGTFLVLISSWQLLRALESNKLKDWIIYGLLTAAGLYTHYYLVFSIAAQGLYFLYYVYQSRKLSDSLTFKGLGSYVFAAVLYLPWLPTFLTQIKRVEAAYWIPAPDRWSVPSTIWKMVFGGQGNDHITLFVSAVIAIVLLFYFFRETKPPIRWFIVLGVAVPFIGALLLSFKQAIYLDRYFVFASLYFTILIAATLFLVPKYTTRRALVVIFAAMSLILFFKNWQDLNVKNLFFNRAVNNKPGMAGASAFINNNARSTDKIYVGSSFVYFTFKYYNHTNIPPLLYAPGSLESIPHFSGTAILTNDDLILDFHEAKKNDTVWLLWTTGFGGSKPNVPGNWNVVAEKDFPDTPGFKGNIVVTEYHID